VRFVNEYHADAAYLDALAESIEEHWRQAGGRTHLLLSYHGIPTRYVAEGDPYQEQAEATTRALATRLGLGAADYSHAYQSRFGPVRWLQPYTIDTIKELRERGVTRLTVASPSFAVDCLETLEEVAVEYRDEFLRLGGEQLTLVPALNASDAHARLLAGVARRHLTGWVDVERAHRAGLDI
jgi:ferrochelatase